MLDYAERPETLEPPAAAPVVLDRRVRAGYLGAKTDHCENITRLFATMESDLVYLPDSVTWGMYKRPPTALNWPPAKTLWKKSTRLASQFRGTRHRPYLNDVLEQIDTHDLNCIIAYWGTAMIGDMIAIKKMRPDIKIIFNCLCHPLGLSRLKVAMQNRHFSRSVKFLDGIILPSHVTKAYVQQNVLRGQNVPCLVSPPCYSRHYFPAKRRPRCAVSPNVLFMGRMDWYRAQPSDDVRPFIDQVLDAGVHVFHHAAEGSPPHANRHTFEYLPLLQAEEYATAFDAALILYNLDACPRTDRFELTVPDRLLASVTAGIPIAIPAKGYAACKEYLQPYEAVVEFTSAADLARHLQDRPRMERLADLARANSEKFMAERHLPALAQFITGIVAGSPIAVGKRGMD